MFQKILIANRGEIAVRIIRACREMGIKTVAVYSKAEKEALHTQLADEAVCIGPAQSSASYLNMESILSAAVTSGAQAIHPGFGFLSENSKFARMCEKCGIVFIGPSPETMDEMGNKSQARALMEQAGVPIVPGTKEAVHTAEKALEEARKIGFPVMIKAALGGGGKGMRVSYGEADFEENFRMAQLESVKGFGDDSMYLEKFVEHPKHIEFQILADRYGNVVQLGERDCSIQRHHQKMIEESPCVSLSSTLRRQMGEEAVKAAKAAGYENAGTVEFLLDHEGHFYFCEMNTRIQVEHPVTEMVCGVDLVKEQISIAAGNPLSIRQEDVVLQGYALECRINAEDPAKNFCPCPGKLGGVHLPGGFGVRIDTAVYSGSEVLPFYDSMLAKIIVHDKTREGAIDKMRSTLGELILEGVTTNLDFQYELLGNADFRNGIFDTGFLETHYSCCR
jgi:acetyl-CoA carboxylase, biotin carboxylase subunit